MVSLTNQARLLAAQEFNKRVLQQKAKAGKRITTSSTRVGVLTGRKAITNKAGKVVGVSRTKSKTRLDTERLLRAEIKRQQQLRSKESDLEKFLKNEQRLSRGNITRAELNRQIAERKRKGLSKTPAQKRALSLFTQTGSRSALQARNIRKAGRGRTGEQIQSADTLLGILGSEAGRAGQLGSAPFADPSFQFGGRSRQEVTRRGGTFGRRAGGESISQQLAFVSGARKGTSTARISFAESLLGDDLFGGASSASLLGVVGSQSRSADPTKRARGARSQAQFAPPTFEQVLRKDVGLFTTRAVPVTKPKLTKGERRQLVKARKAEDFAQANVSRREVAVRPRQDDFERISVLGSQVIQSSGTASQQRNAELREQGFTPSQIRDINQGKKPRGKPITSQQRLALAQITQRETEALRASGGTRASDIPNIFGRESFGASGFGFGGEIKLTPATGKPSRTETFFPTPRGNIFQLNLSEGLAIGESRPQKPTKKRIRGGGTETIQVLGSQVTQPNLLAGSGAIQRGGFFDFLGDFGGAFQSLIGGAPLVESKKSKTKISTREAVGAGFDFFSGRGSVGDVLETGGGLARGELLEGISLGDAFRESPLSRDNPFAGIGNFFAFGR